MLYTPFECVFVLGCLPLPEGCVATFVFHVVPYVFNSAPSFVGRPENAAEEKSLLRSRGGHQHSPSRGEQKRRMRAPSTTDPVSLIARTLSPLSSPSSFLFLSSIAAAAASVLLFAALFSRRFFSFFARVCVCWWLAAFCRWECFVGCIRRGSSLRCPPGDASVEGELMLIGLHKITDV